MIFRQQKQNKTVEILNDLIEIHNDRIAGYELAASAGILGKELQDEFKHMASNAHHYKNELKTKVSELKGIEKNFAIVGKIYSAWMDLKGAFSCDTRKAIIASCRYNEEIALQVYNAALSSQSALSPETSALLEAHYAGIKEELAHISGYREIPRHYDTSAVYFS